MHWQNCAKWSRLLHCCRDCYLHISLIVSVLLYHFFSSIRELFVSFYNFPRVDRIRAMSTEKIGRLISISGTVTRSSEVRPELLFGFFICKFWNLFLFWLCLIRVKVLWWFWVQRNLSLFSHLLRCAIYPLGFLFYNTCNSLLLGKKCGSQLPAVEQQFQYTEPQICKNPQCKTAGDFQLVVDKSAFVDWQRLRVQVWSCEMHLLYLVMLYFSAY